MKQYTQIADQPLTQVRLKENRTINTQHWNKITKQKVSTKIYNRDTKSLVITVLYRHIYCLALNNSCLATGRFR